MEMTRQWYIVYTKPGQEQKVCEALRRKKLDSFYPVNKMVKLSYGKEKVSFKPLLERYVFVYLNQEEQNIITQISGITSFIHWLLKPVTISGDDIYLLKHFFHVHDDIHLEKIKVNISEPATISGSLADADNNTDVVTFTLPALGYKLIAQVSKTTVKVITVPAYQSKTNFTKQYAEAR